jgi:phenylacetate-CoA ligase
VPFYEHRLDAVLKPNGDIDWDRWSEIPIVKRQDMIDHRDAMQARELPAGHGPTAVFETSGSTSLPISITTNALMTLSSNACRWRAHQRNGIDWSKNIAVRLGNTTARLDGPYADFKGEWGPNWIPNRGMIWELNVRLPSIHALEFLKLKQCAYLNTGAAPAHVFALECERLGIDPPPLEVILAQGASVGPHDRAACERVFGARILETYSSKEAGQIAHPCEHGQLHVNVETCLLEIVDGQGAAVPPGASGRAIATPFFSTAQPLIRYDQGDIIRAGGACRCGRVSPTLAGVEGRHSLFFTHPDGRRATSLLPDSGRELLDCTFWQIAQVGPLEFEVRYVPNDWDRHGNEAGLIRLFHEQYFDDAIVSLRRVREIPLSSSGKYIEYTVELAAKEQPL